MNQYYKQTIAIIEDNKQLVETLAKKLLEVETMTADDFRIITSKFLQQEQSRANNKKTLW